MFPRDLKCYQQVWKGAWAFTQPSRQTESTDDLGGSSFTTGRCDLASKGFTVRQLLHFYAEKIQHDTMTTNDVVRDIIIPETAVQKTCYMDSGFMRGFGGRHRAKRLVSHAWKSQFLNTVLNIVLGAWGCGKNKLLPSDGELMSRQPWWDIEYKFKAAELLKCLDESVLSKTYWLCIFAVNEHNNICGTCWNCNPYTKD